MSANIKTLVNPITLVSAIILLLSGCSGGNAGSSSGSGETDTTSTPSTGDTTNIRSGQYDGNIDFDGLNSSASISIEVETNGNVIVTSNDTGSATGTATDSSFISSGTISFNVGTQVCSGFTTVEGSGSGRNRLSGTVSTPTADCVENGVNSTISLEGTFTANR